MKTLYRIEKVQGRTFPEIVRGGYESQAEAQAIATAHSGYDATTDTVTSYSVVAYLEDAGTATARRSPNCRRCGGPVADGSDYCGEC